MKLFVQVIDFQSRPQKDELKVSNIYLCCCLAVRATDYTLTRGGWMQNPDAPALRDNCSQRASKAGSAYSTCRLLELLPAIAGRDYCRVRYITSIVFDDIVDPRS